MTSFVLTDFKVEKQKLVCTLDVSYEANTSFAQGTHLINEETYLV